MKGALAWTIERWDIGRPPGQGISFGSGGRSLSCAQVLQLWQDADFADVFMNELAAAPFESFFWEMPPFDAGTLSRPFECAAIRAEGLAEMKADDRAFAEYLDAPSAETVAAFANLGGDALLIVPRRVSAADCYAHIAAFARRGPPTQRRDLLRLVATKAKERLAAGLEPFWISTSGLGVPWVHVRLDSYPKYVQHARYRDFP